MCSGLKSVEEQLQEKHVELVSLEAVAQKEREQGEQDKDALLEVCRERDGLKERCEELEVRCQHEHELEEREKLSVTWNTFAFQESRGPKPSSEIRSGVNDCQILWDNSRRRAPRSGIYWRLKSYTGTPLFNA